MTQCVDPNVPTSTLLIRWEKHVERLQKDIERCHWWQWNRRTKLKGAIGAYRHEMPALLQWTGGQQPILREHVKGLMGKEVEKRRP